MCLGVCEYVCVQITLHLESGVWFDSVSVSGHNERFKVTE